MERADFLTCINAHIYDLESISSLILTHCRCWYVYGSDVVILNLAPRKWQRTYTYYWRGLTIDSQITDGEQTVISWIRKKCQQEQISTCDRNIWHNFLPISFVCLSIHFLKIHARLERKNCRLPLQQSTPLNKAKWVVKYWYIRIIAHESIDKSWNRYMKYYNLWCSTSNVFQTWKKYFLHRSKFWESDAI